MDSIQQMKLFIRIVEVGSLSRAAEQLGMSNPAVSRYLQALESKLGTRLLNRTTRHIQLTADGERFYHRCGELLADLDELHGMFQQSEHNLSGKIRIAATQGTILQVILPRLPEFYARYPALQIELISQDFAADLVRGGFDCAIHIGELPESNFIAKPITTLRRINCASPIYLQQHGTPQQLSDLPQHKLIGFSSYFNSFDYLQQGEPHQQMMPIALWVNTITSYNAAAEQGLGICQTLAISARLLLQQGKLLEILPDYAAPSLPVYLIYPHRKNLPQRVRVFMEWLERICEQFVNGI